MIGLFASAPALPLHKAGPYVAAAYIVILLVILIYVWIMASRLTRSSRELRELRRQVEQQQRQATTEPGPVQPGADEPVAKQSEPVA